MQEASPTQVVAAQLSAYNARDLETFITFWAHDVQVYQFPDTLLFSGHEELRRRHAVRFLEPDLYAELLHRRVLGNWVFDQERVIRTASNSVGLSGKRRNPTPSPAARIFCHSLRSG